MDTMTLAATAQQHDCSDGFSRDLYVLDGMLVCEFCRSQVQPDRVVGPSPDEIGAGEECTKVACGRRCQWESWDADFLVSVTWAGQDGEAPCACEHHDEYRKAVAA